MWQSVPTVDKMVLKPRDTLIHLSRGVFFYVFLLNCCKYTPWRRIFFLVPAARRRAFERWGRQYFKELQRVTIIIIIMLSNTHLWIGTFFFIDNKNIWDIIIKVRQSVIIVILYSRRFDVWYAPIDGVVWSAQVNNKREPIWTYCELFLGIT